MKKIKTMDGNEACSYTSYMFTEVSGIYPITPSSPMAEHIDEWACEGRKNIFNDKVKIVEMQSEAGAAGMVHGSLQAGLLTTTFTASQGLLLMIPNMYKIAGEMLPCVIHVAARSLSTHALSIFGDHQDIYATRMTGFAMIASSSVQDASYLSGVAHLAAIKASLPFMHFFDGFRTSHEINKIEVLEMEDYKNLIDYDALNKFRKKALNPLKPVIRGTNQNDDIYFQNMEARNKNYLELPDIVNEYMKKINTIAGTNYRPFNYYGSQNAKKVIVAMGSVCETIKETIDNLGEELGLIEVHLYRPFSTKYLKEIMPNTVSKIAVLDRTKEPGSNGEPLYLDIVAALKDTDIEIVGGRYGLSSKNTTPGQIKAVYDMLDKPKNNFTIGIDDDVTNLSLKEKNIIIDNALEFLLYGYGSDGMVSAGKSMIKLIGDNTDKLVQGYFEYDSKKSGGVTIGHLRFSDHIIRKPYYVENPSIITISKDTYLSEFDILNKIKENGICIVNTSKTEEELLNSLNENNKYYLKNKNVSLYIINAYELARKVGLQNKISMIMETVTIKLSNLIDFEFAKENLKKYVRNEFFKKGEEIVKMNEKAIDESLEYIKKVNYNIELEELTTNNSDNIYEVITKRKGNELKVSDLLKYVDGTFDIDTASLEKRGISDIVPKWINSNCINCNQCSFVCPHGVIRPFLLSKEEYDKAPEYVKNKCTKPILKNLDDYYYILGISIKDCTGCGLCINTCPGLKGEKALIKEKLDKQISEKEQEIFDYLNKNIKNKNLINKNTVIGSQYEESKIKYEGACAGCGEPAYIKILTQLFGESMIIANATGCSSIYGASLPSLPYSVPWASSLFEDNAEYGYGILTGNNVIKNRIQKIMNDNLNNPNGELFKKWLNNYDDYKTTKEVYDNLDDNTLPKELLEIKDYIPKRSIWIVGGDGWAYDIGYGGIDHILSSNDDVNILVLDSQVYSNTGGQASKSSPKGSIASFATSGKNSNKKDLARMALAYPHVYVAQISLGANMLQTIKAFEEAEKHKGPSIIIAYTPCIAHGIKGGMQNSVSSEKMATACGYFPIFRYNPQEEKLYLDSKNINFDLYEEYLLTQNRYKSLKLVNEKEALKLLEENKENAIKRFEYYKWLSEK